MQIDLISQFCDDTYVTIAANFLFQCENSKVNLSVCVNIFLITNIKQ